MQNPKGSMLWRGLKAVLWTAGAMAFPFSVDINRNKLRLPQTIKRLAVYAFAWNMLPFSALLFPRAEKELAAQDLDPRLAAQLAPGKKIYVMKDNLAGRLGAYAQESSPYGWPVALYNWGKLDLEYLDRPSISAFAQPRALRVFNNVCTIYIKNRGDQAEKERRAVEKKFKGATYKAPLTLKQRKALTTLHEIVHCGDENQALTSDLQQEAESDRHAAIAMAAKWGEGIKDKVISERLYYDAASDHDTALYLDISFRKAAMPPIAEIEAANKKARQITGAARALGPEAGKYDFVPYCNGPDKSFCDPTPPSPLAQQRIDLWNRHWAQMIVRKP